MVSHARTVWEEGREPGHQVVTLGTAVALTALLIDLILTDGVSVLFDVAFALLCIVLALVVRPDDFFTAGVLPPLLMVGVFTFVALVRPSTVGDRGDGTVQAVISGLSHHSEALVTGYVLCLAVLLVRTRVMRSDPGPRLRA